MEAEDPLIQIAIVYNLDEQTIRGEPEDLIAIQYTANTTQYLFDAFCALGYATSKIAVRTSLEDFKWELSQFSPKNTFIFNNCDGFSGENIGSVLVTRIIEEMGFKHTGATADVVELCIDKAQTKKRLMAFGVPTPLFQVIEDPGEELHLQLPVILKPLTEDGSIGIDLRSVAATPADFRARLAYIIERYCQPAMVEEYISGREFAVAMWGNLQVETLPIAEEDYSWVQDPLQRFLTYEAKWDEKSPYFQNINVCCPASLAEIEAERVCQTAVAAYRAIGLRDFGRVDIRYRDGIPFIIDVNEIPDLSPESGYPRTAQIAGYTYNAMVEKLLDFALRREGWR